MGFAFLRHGSRFASLCYMACWGKTHLVCISLNHSLPISPWSVMSAFRRTVHDLEHETSPSRTPRCSSSNGLYHDSKNSKGDRSMSPSRSHHRFEREVDEKPSRRLTLAATIAGALLGRTLSKGDRLWSVAGATVGAAAAREMGRTRRKKD